MSLSDRVYPSEHAMEAMNSRRISWSRVIAIIDHPEVVYGPDIKGYKTYQQGKYSVVVAKDKVVITVLLREYAQWDDNEARKLFLNDVATLHEHWESRTKDIVSKLMSILGASYQEVTRALRELDLMEY